MSEALDNRIERLADELDTPGIVEGGWSDVVQRASDRRSYETPRRQRPRRRWAFALAGTAAAAVAILVATFVRSPGASPAAGPLHSIVYHYTNTGTFGGVRGTVRSRHEIDYARHIARITELSSTNAALRMPYPVQIFTEQAIYMKVPDAKRAATGGKAWIRAKQSTDWQETYGRYSPEFESPVADLTRRLQPSHLTPTTVGTETVGGQVTTHLRATQTIDTVTEVTDLWVDRRGRMVRQRVTRNGLSSADAQVEEVSVQVTDPPLAISLPSPSETLTVASTQAADELLAVSATPSQRQASLTQARQEITAFLNAWAQGTYREAANTYLAASMQVPAGASGPKLLSGRLINSRLDLWTNENDFVMSVNMELHFAKRDGIAWNEGNNDRFVHFTRNDPGQGFTMTFATAP